LTNPEIPRVFVEVSPDFENIFSEKTFGGPRKKSGKPISVLAFPTIKQTHNTI